MHAIPGTKLYCRNPVDALIVAQSIKFVRKWTATPSFSTLQPVEQTPGPAVQTEDEIVAYLRDTINSSTAHSCCTAAMAPHNLGGVVDDQLLVYGVTGLSVGDVSIIPMIPGTHTCATVYATAEKVRKQLLALL